MEDQQQEQLQTDYLTDPATAIQGGGQTWQGDFQKLTIQALKKLVGINKYAEEAVQLDCEVNP